MNHTPAPWANDATIPLKAVDCERLEYSIVFVNGHREQEAQANARLIAAAPDLLAALEALLSDVGPSSGLPSAIQAREAIAKARGQ